MLATREHVKTIFGQAAELASSDEQSRFLDQACSGEPALRAEVEELLGAMEKAGDFLVARPGLDRTIDQPTERIGTLIGPYKLLEQIGEGGMGLVYMAEQQRPMRRLVALKLIKPGMDSRQVIARFEAEWQALAMMDHQNIAKVFEAGTTESGRPYFVMELVRGIPINEFCDQKRLTVRERLELMIQVCQAVQHAHQKGIIHRDLKPTNVLVTMNDATPLPKVIDFGIAKALGASLTEHTLHTGFAQLVGTPLYMSPEQAEMNHLGVDTRSDVYSLGVLLYELLTGTTPFDKETLSKAGLDEMRRIIREDEPPRPSARVSTLEAQDLSTISERRNTDTRRISITLHGELDWIVMKALAKDRSERYESASALAADIQRYLVDEPVQACPPSASYRFRKFARKHKPALTTAAVIAASLILGTTVSAWQAIRATQAEAQATANEQKAVANEAQAMEAAAAEAQQRQRAEANAQKAVVAAATAQEKAQEAATQRDEAQKQRDEVKALNDKLQVTQAELRSTLYASTINLAKHAWDSNDPERVRALLAQLHPKTGESDLRGFEWHYLYRLCNNEFLTLKGHTSEVESVAYSPDGKHIASCASGTFDATKKGFVGGEVKLWDAQTGQERFTFPCQAGSVVFSPDGKLLASAGGALKLWNVQTGEELNTFQGRQTDLVWSVAFSPDGKHLALAVRGTWDDANKAYRPAEIVVADVRTGGDLFKLKGHTADVHSVTYSPDGKRLASAAQGVFNTSKGAYAGEVKIWDVETHQEVPTLNTTGRSVVFSPDGQRLAIAGGQQLKIYDTQTGEEVQSLPCAASGIAFSPDGKRLASGEWGWNMQIWDLQTAKVIQTVTGSGRSVGFSPDGKRLVSASSDRSVKVWDAQEDTGNLTMYVNGRRIVVMSPDGRRLARASPDKSVLIKDVQTGQELFSLKGHIGNVDSLAFSPDGKRLASGASGPTNPNGTRDEKFWGRTEVKVWNAITGEELLTLPMSMGSVRVAFSPDGKVLACVSRASGSGKPATAKLWDAQTAKELRSLENTDSTLHTVVFSPDGSRLAGVGADKVKLWDAQTGKELFSVEGRRGDPNGVAFSADGKRLASASGSPGFGPFMVKIWDAQTGQELVTLQGAAGFFSGIAFSPDGKRLASAAFPFPNPFVKFSTTLNVWNAQTGQELLSLAAGSGRGLAFSPDGHHLAIGTEAGPVQIYDATPLPEKP